jgi:hypothetical protein
MLITRRQALRNSTFALGGAVLKPMTVDGKAKAPRTPEDGLSRRPKDRRNHVRKARPLRSRPPQLAASFIAAASMAGSVATLHAAPLPTTW